MTSFQDLGVPPKITAALRKRGIDAPFPIQALTIADAMAGRDLCGRAPTGSGKTLAFGIPVAARARKGQPRRPSALILVPTRELAAQVAGALTPLAQACDLHVAAFYGGTPIGKDRQRLTRGIDIAVACPGRLEDLVARGFADLSRVDLVVIDEADRMADMGFLPVVRRLLDQTASQRQTLLFSATLDGEVDALVKGYQRSPVRHEHEAAVDEVGDVRHLFWSAEPHERVGLTREIVSQASPAIVFTRTKHGADRVARQLSRSGVGAVAIHGNRNQSQRQRALDDFTAGRATVLVATDVAARGIHVDNVGVVVHFDPAGTDKDYVHRSGRTGRAGADGVVVTLVPPDKRKDVTGMLRALGLPEAIGVPTLTHLAAGFGARIGTLTGTLVDAPQVAAGGRTSNSQDRARGGQSRAAGRTRAGAGTNAGARAPRGSHAHGKGGNTARSTRRQRRAA